MDIPGNQQDELYRLVINFLQQNTSDDLTHIEQFIMNHRGISINHVDPVRYGSLLYIAINYGCLPMVKFLVEHNANIIQILPNGNVPFATAYQKAVKQNDENDQMQVAMGYKKPQFKKVFLYLLTCILQNQLLFDTAIENDILTPGIIQLAIPLARQYNDLELAGALENVLQNIQSESD